jgi:DNA-binding transcriptional ArsR family regulator
MVELQAMNEDNTRSTHPLVDLDKVIHSPARLMVMTYLYAVESVDYIFLMRLTGLTWGNLSSHLSTLEDAGYIEVEKRFVGKKAQTMLHLTEDGRDAFRGYKHKMLGVLEDLPD